MSTQKDDYPKNGKLTEVPEDFDPLAHRKLTEDDFDDPAIFLDHEIRIAKLQVAKANKSLTDAKATLSALEKRKAFFNQMPAELRGDAKVNKGVGQLFALTESLQAQGIDISELIPSGGGDKDKGGDE